MQKITPVKGERKRFNVRALLLLVRESENVVAQTKKGYY